MFLPQVRRLQPEYKGFEEKKVGKGFEEEKVGKVLKKFPVSCPK